MGLSLVERTQAESNRLSSCLDHNPAVARERVESKQQGHYTIPVGRSLWAADYSCSYCRPQEQQFPRLTAAAAAAGCSTRIPFLRQVAVFAE